MAGGKLKEVRTRMASVTSTQQITKAMKMVSAAKLRKAQDRILQMRPYATNLSKLMSNILSGMDGSVDLSYAEERKDGTGDILIVLITSDKGLCGGFNSNLIKKARHLIENTYAGKTDKIKLMLIGKKGHDYFKKQEQPLFLEYKDLFFDLTFDNTAEAATFCMDGFVNKQFDVVDLIYSQFKNAATQNFTIERFLPIAPLEVNELEPKGKVPDFIFEPSQEEIVEFLIPKILKTQFFKALLDSNASEHGARMTAMDKASENANDLLKELRISYNRARQADITTELTEIVGGAAALEGE